MPILLPILAQAAAITEAPLADPMAGVTADWYLCNDPDDAAKTCKHMSSFVRTGDGQYQERDRLMVIGLPGLVIEYATSAYLKDGKLCSVAHRKNFESARIVQHAEGPAAKQEAVVMQHIRYMAPVEGKEVCGQFFPDGQRFAVKVSVNGKPSPDIDAPMSWVHKDDGYTVVGWRGAITTRQ